ncbi:MAG: U32 family peptidase [Eubacteriaceae bacterium]|nr:U32 family peptidase [Eubacteriaceae bacterium]
MKQTELLSPAGDMEAVRAAVMYGADAVYAGGPFLQLRSSRAGFSVESLAEACSLVHACSKKLYVTVNSFAYTDEVSLLGDYASELANIGVDALIVSDLGAIDTIKRNVPSMPVHVSTQANCMNAASAMVYRSLGAERIVLARELSLEEIKKMRRSLPDDLVLEAFVHGAMCMAYSGRCLISSYLTGRSGNRGECTQPCRWKYYLYEENRPGEYFPVEEDGEKSAILSSHDMKMIDHLDEMRDAGIYSFKIEGRMKTGYYCATVTNAYRMALDGCDDREFLNRELEAVSHRPYSTGFYYGEERKNTYNDGEYTQQCRFVGVVRGSEQGMLKVEQRNHFSRGDVLEALSPAGRPVRIEVREMYDEERQSIDSAPHPMQTVLIPSEISLQEGSILRRWDGEERHDNSTEV